MSDATIPCTDLSPAVLPAAETGGSRGRPVDLGALADTVGITDRSALSGGAFNIWGNTFPAHELPAPGEVAVDGYRFRFPAGPPGGPDHLRCSGQTVALPAGRYDWIQLLAAAERRTEDEIWLHYADGSIDPEWIRVSDFWPETPARFGESVAVRTTRMHYPRHSEHRMRPVIWRQRVPVPREQPLTGLRLPDNPALHIFAMTLVPAVEEVRG